MKPQDEFDEYYVEYKNNDFQFAARYTTYHEDNALEWFETKSKEYDYVELFGRNWEEVSIKKQGELVTP